MAEVQTIYLRPDTPKGLYEGPVEWTMPTAGNLNILDTKTLNVTNNGVYTITPGANYDAMVNAVVNVQVEAPALNLADVNVNYSLASLNNTSNFTINIPAGADGINSVTITFED